MKIFVVFAVVIASSYANSVGRAGWGANRPSNNILLNGAGAAAGAGQAAGQQALAELVAGSHEIPALLASNDGVIASLGQGDVLSQIVTVDKPSGASSTINTADTYHDAVADDTLNAAGSGEYIVSVQNSANTDVSGEGALAADAETINDSVTVPSGWKH